MQNGTLTFLQFSYSSWSDWKNYRLYDKGCDVTGVEISELAIKHLYDQHNIPYTSVQSSSPDFTLYQVRYALCCHLAHH